MEKTGVVPDFLCLSKGLTGGTLPLAATVVSEEIYQAFLSDSKAQMFFHGHSFTGNPISCAAPVANIRLFKKNFTKEKLAEIESAQKLSLQKIEKKFPIQDVRVCGTVGAFDLATDEPGYLSEISGRLMTRALKQGLFIRPLGQTVYLMPPYCSTRAEVEDCWSIVARSLTDLNQIPF